VEPFADPNTGCVSGRLIYENRQATPVSRGETLYWNYENRLKALESRFHTLLGANGSMYAIRRAAYRPLDPDVSDDFGLPLAVYAQGYRVVFQPAAVSREEAPSTPGMEFRKKSRFVSHQLTTLSRLWPMLKPLERPRFLFQLMSHKLLRNMAPFFLIGMLGTSFSIPAPYGPALLSLQGLFYGAAVMGMALQRLRRPFRLFTLPFYFCLVNAAAVAGIAHFFRRKNYAAWNEK
jgi:cellulose synthase/poly-beta-1,6-N-acetylglucosamine synthase-like glycosyltransferase